MRKSVIDQEWRAEALREGLEQGLQQEATVLTLRQLRRKLGPLQEGVAETVGSLSTQQLEALAEALLEFQTPADLMAWLRDPSLESI